MHFISMLVWVGWGHFVVKFLVTRFSFRFYGESVVEACVEAGAHHLDISGEPAFLEKVQLKYHQKVMVR